MPTARELLSDADALIRRNRARAVDTEIPELTEAVAEVVPAPAPTVLADIPELTDSVEEIEISSIVEMPDDRSEASSWLHFDPERASILSRAADTISGESGPPTIADPEAKIAESLRTVAAHAEPAVAPPPVAPTKQDSPVASAPPGAPVAPAAQDSPVASAPLGTHVAPTPEVEPVARAAPDPAAAAEENPAEAPPAAEPALADTWARWAALGDEIRMQVLHRVDLFTEASMREQLGAQLQPIVDRAGAEMVAKVNEQIGKLLREHIAREIEREIEKRRKDHV